MRLDRELAIMLPGKSPRDRKAKPKPGRRGDCGLPSVEQLEGEVNVIWVQLSALTRHSDACSSVLGDGVQLERGRPIAAGVVEHPLQHGVAGPRAEQRKDFRIPGQPEIFVDVERIPGRLGRRDEVNLFGLADGEHCCDVRRQQEIVEQRLNSPCAAHEGLRDLVSRCRVGGVELLGQTAEGRDRGAELVPYHGNEAAARSVESGQGVLYVGP